MGVNIEVEGIKQDPPKNFLLNHGSPTKNFGKNDFDHVPLIIYLCV